MEIGPSFSGESSDRSIASEGDNQPIALPWHRVIMLAAMELKKLL